MSVFPLRESFSGSTAPTNWKLFPGAKMTGEGWLRLVPATSTQAGTAFLTKEFPSSLGITVEFDLAAWGGSTYDGRVGDGISFYLIDGSKDLKNVGGPGGALGYARHHPTNKPGVNDGYVGIGIDQWGAFSSEKHAGTGGPGVTKNQVVVRGRGDQNSGFAYCKGADLPQLSLSREKPTRVHLTIISGKVSVGVHGTNGVQKLIQDFDLTKVDGQKKPPKQLKLGLSAATGAATNHYEVRNLVITLPAEMPLSIAGSTTAVAGEPFSYTITVENKGPNDVPDAKVTGSVAKELTGAKIEKCDLSGGAEKVGEGSITNGALEQKLKLPNGGKATLTIKGTIRTGFAGTMPNTAKVESATCANTATKASDSLSTTVRLPEAKVPLKMGGPSQAYAGTPIEYTVTVSNGGTNTVPEAKISGTIPAEVINPKIEKCELSGGAEKIGEGSVIKGDLKQSVKLPAGGQAVLAVKGTVKSGYQGPLTATSKVETPNYANTATKTSDSVATTVTAPTGKVSLSMGGRPATGEAGKPLTYTVTVTNEGSTDVPKVEVTGKIPDEVTAPKLEEPQLSGGAEKLDKGSVDNGDLKQSLKMPKGSSATLRVTGTVKLNFTGPITATSKVETPNYGNTAPKTSDSVKTTITLPKIDVTVPASGSFEQVEKPKGQICWYDFQLAASKYRIKQWQLYFDGLPKGSKLNPAFKLPTYVTAKKDGSQDGSVLIESDGKAHAIEPENPHTIRLQVWHSSKETSNNCKVYNLKGIAVKEQ
ncbi:hypothetical protein [Streptomyces sp. S186]|uniref:hypothetical protein n=1 Tax=Streptomyces sp. S186 TaxID=3434395 RepID=UPI003F67EA89